MSRDVCLVTNCVQRRVSRDIGRPKTIVSRHYTSANIRLKTLCVFRLYVHCRNHPYLTFQGQSYAFHKPVDSIDLVFAPPNQPIVCGIQRTANAIETAWYAHQQGSKN